MLNGRWPHGVLNVKALVGAFNQEKALVGAFSVIVQPVVEPMDRFTALIIADIPSDISNLARDAALAPVRECSTAQLATIQPQDIRNIMLQVRYFLFLFQC